MQDVEGIFAEAIEVEPNGLEAFAQYAQLKSMLGEYEASLTYLEKALGNARSRDEVIEYDYVIGSNLSSLLTISFSFHFRCKSCA
jgi:tetratricopeptide (TPR) repeat protein